MHRPGARMRQATGRVEQHVALVVGDRQAERHDQGAALQLVIEQGASGDGHADAGDCRFNGQVVAVEGVPAAHVQATGTNPFQIKLPFGVFRTATPGGDVVQQRIVRKVGGTMQGRTSA
ncbi:hypothetical protein D3C79_654760 [compost metagenome]